MNVNRARGTFRANALCFWPVGEFIVASLGGFFNSSDDVHKTRSKLFQSGGWKSVRNYEYPLAFHNLAYFHSIFGGIKLLANHSFLAENFPVSSLNSSSCGLYLRKFSGCSLSMVQ